MKKIIISIMAVCLSIYAIGQKPGVEGKTRPDAETRATELTKRMKDLIHFSDQQEAKVYDLNLQNLKNRREMMQNRTEDREAMKQKMKASEDEYEASLKKILDEKQFNTYLKEKQNLRQQRPAQNEQRKRKNG